MEYRRLNDVTTKDVYPLPRIDDALAKLAGATVFSIMDLQSGYWQVPVAVEDRPKTAFATPDGLYQVKVMPFRLCSAPSTFHWLMDMVLAGLKWTDCLVYMDDVVVFGKDPQEHLARLAKIFFCIRAANLKLKIEKCSFGNARLQMLGHVVSKDGIEPDPKHCDAITAFPPPNFKATEKAKLHRSLFLLSQVCPKFQPSLPYP